MQTFIILLQMHSLKGIFSMSFPSANPSKKGRLGFTHSVRSIVITFVGGVVLLSPLVSAVPVHADTVDELPPVSAADPNEAKLPLTVALKASDPAALHNLASNAQNLSQNERIDAVDAVAPEDKTVDAVVSQFKDAGITVVSHDDWSVNIEATPRQTEQLFHVDLTDNTAQSTTNDTPVLPPSLQNSVSGVLGLDNVPLLTPALYGFQASDLNASGNVTGASSGGAGQTIATVQFSGWNNKDLTQYATKTGLPTPSVTQITVDGQNAVDTSNNSGAMEVALDQQQLLASAPKAKQRIYFAPNTGQGFYNVFDAIAKDVPAAGIDAVSMSWGFCESSVNAYTLSTLTTVIDRVVALGATTFAASGDFGSSACGPGTTADVSFPASAPSVIGVGGTSMTKSGTTYSQKAWTGSGGGQSRVTARPSYQSSVKVNGTKRTVPDVSTIGDPNTGVYGFFGAAGGDFLFGGTSASTPILAAQYVTTLSSLKCTSGLGDIHAAMYAHPSDFVDVTTGSNGAYSATAGYDMTTGLGVPQWSKLAAHLPLTGTCVTPTPVASTQPAPAAKTVLKSGQSLYSSNSQYTLTMQPDSNLVLYGNGPSTRALWSTSTSAKLDGATVQISTTGNLQVISKDGKTSYWNSGTANNGSNANTVQLTNDGMIQLKNGSKIVWSPAISGRDTLVKGATLKANQYVKSADGKHQLIFKADGNLVAYNGTKVIWSTNTANKAPGGRFTYQADGNLVVYNSANKAVWTASTSKKASNRFIVQNDGNIVLYNTKTLVWSTKTTGK
jgi:hypothetical protein